MDFTVVLIIILAIIIIGVIFFMLSAQSKPKETKPAEAAPQKDAPQKRFKSSISAGDLQSDMKAEEQELLTQYTAGTGEGISEVEKLLEGDPNNVDLLDWLAFMYYSNNNIDSAIEAYKRALAIKPDNENQHYYLANSYYKKSMNAEAKREWSEVIRLRPNSKIAKNSQERIDFLKSQGK